MELWLSSWLSEQEVRASIPGLAATISEIGYLLLPSRDMAEIPLKRCKNNQPTEGEVPHHFVWCLSVPRIADFCCQCVLKGGAIAKR